MRCYFRVIYLALTLACASSVCQTGDLFVCSIASSQVLRYSGTTGAFGGVFVPAGSGGLNAPGAAVFGPDGRLYVTSGTPPSSSVLRYNGTTGAFIDAFVPAGSGGLNDAAYLTFGPDGALYVSDFNAGNVKRYNGSTGAFMGVFTSGTTLANPQGLKFGPDGNLYVADQVKVVRFNGTTGVFIDVFVPAGRGGLIDPVGLSFGPDGNLYVGSSLSHSVLRYNGATGAFINAFVPAGSGGLNRPHGVIFGPDGNLYVADEASQVLRYNGTTGLFIDVFVPAGSGGLSVATGITFAVHSPQYNVCLLYDPSKAVKSGATIPIKLQLCDSNGNNLSSSNIGVHATGITLTSTSASGVIQDSGNANPDNDFRFDANLGSTGGYIFNLSTKSLTTAIYNLNFTVTGDSFVYVAPFQVR